MNSPSLSSTPPLYVCLYSKYSTHCKKFLEFLLSDEKNSIMDMKMLCVDYEPLRRIVIQDIPHFDITTVPTLLVFHSHGGMEKFEGFQAFSYVTQICSPSSNTSSTSLSLQSSLQPPQSLSTSTPSGMTVESSSSTSSLPEPSPIETPPHMTMTQNQDIPPEATYGTKKKESVMNLAATMAKQREQEEEKSNPNPYVKVAQAQETIMNSSTPIHI